MCFWYLNTRSIIDIMFNTIQSTYRACSRDIFANSWIESRIKTLCTRLLYCYIHSGSRMFVQISVLCEQLCTYAYNLYNFYIYCSVLGRLLCTGYCIQNYIRLFSFSQKEMYFVAKYVKGNSFWGVGGGRVILKYYTFWNSGRNKLIIFYIGGGYH